MKRIRISNKTIWQALSLRSALVTAVLFVPLAALHAADKPTQPTRPDIVIADFEPGYGDWVVTGEA